MSMFLNREGNISVFRVGVLMALLGVIAVIAGLVFWQLEIERRKSAFNVPVYPEATEVRRDEMEGQPQRVIYYTTEASPSAVAEHYQQELDDHTGQDPNATNKPETCERTPANGNFEDYEPGSGNLPFYYRCVFDNSFLNYDHLTVVHIEPGVRNEAEDSDNTGQTIILYDQRWSR